MFITPEVFIMVTSVFVKLFWESSTTYSKQLQQEYNYLINNLFGRFFSYFLVTIFSFNLQLLNIFKHFFVIMKYKKHNAAYVKIGDLFSLQTTF